MRCHSHCIAGMHYSEIRVTRSVLAILYSMQLRLWMSRFHPYQSITIRRTECCFLFSGAGFTLNYQSPWHKIAIKFLPIFFIIQGFGVCNLLLLIVVIHHQILKKDWLLMPPFWDDKTREIIPKYRFIFWGKLIIWNITWLDWQSLIKHNAI